jgi:hypothetical protein
MDEQKIREKIEQIEKRIVDLTMQANRELAYLNGQKDALSALLEKPQESDPEKKN